MGYQGISFPFISPNWQFPGDGGPGQEGNVSERRTRTFGFLGFTDTVLSDWLVLSRSGSCVVCVL